MGNPYTSVSSSGYNSSPPPDDGSTGASNEITWSGIKTKLSDPLKTLADSVNTNILAAFAKIFGADISSISTNYTVVSGDQGKYLACSGTHTITLPAAATIAKPFCIAVKNIGTGVTTIDGNASETIDGATTITLQPNGWAILATDSSAWRSVGVSFKYPTRTELTSGSGTYTVPTGATRINVRMWGAGGGGGAGNSSVAATTGGSTTFGTLTAAGGGGGSGSPTVGTGGAGTNGDINVTGGDGDTGTESASGSAANGKGGRGGGAGGGTGGFGADGAAGKMGSGGGGGGVDLNGSIIASGCGGGAGAYVEKLITAPSATYSYAVGSGGAGNTSPGTSGHSGGSGGAGLIVIDEFYD